MLETYPSKILLLGEYTILNGSQALAIPFSTFSGSWSFQSIDSDKAIRSRNNLMSFLNSSDSRYFDFDKLKNDLQSGMWFDSTIPQGFGLGSSGALIAALFDRYGNKVEGMIEKKNILASLEGFFHGSSSGIDPLVSLLKRPLLIHSFESIEFIEKPFDLNNFFLIDSGRPRNTGPLVSIYQEKMKNSDFKRGCAEILAREVNFAIENVLKQSDQKVLFHHLWLISKFQWEFFQEMIPEHLKALWSQGLDSGDYILKLCGAGGGGYILGYAPDRASTNLDQKFENFQITPIC